MKLNKQSLNRIKPPYTINLLLLGLLSMFSVPAFARQTPTLPEPSLLSLMGIGAVGAIIAYRIRNKK